MTLEADPSSTATTASEEVYCTIPSVIFVSVTLFLHIFYPTTTKRNDGTAIDVILSAYQRKSGLKSRLPNLLQGSKTAEFSALEDGWNGVIGISQHFLHK